MYIKNIKLINFRTYENIKIEFNEKLNILYGDNAVGKTNILESIYISCITKSYRTIKDIECINFNKEFTNIVSEFNNRTVKIDIKQNNEKNIYENDIKIKKYSDFIGKNTIVVFSPDSMNIIKGSPQKRRKFIDILISQLSKVYFINLQEYNKLVNIKNKLLKEQDIDYIYLDILNEKLSEKIKYISNQREKYIKILNEKAENIHKKMTNNTEIIKIIYESEFKDKTKEEILKILKESINYDIIKKTSNKGITRDDILIYIDEKEVSKYGSQGQSRTSLLSLEFAEAEILKEDKQDTPIILLDDVFSELDNDRINYLLQFINDSQVFITTTDINNIKKSENMKIFKIEKKGFVKVEKELYNRKSEV